ncbi:hypothetical protein GQX73_g10686 [Xylaria multiplex]|uniref:Uncharacterized protein n=1 Tax=Xylaria multiplex TaxID=323545 RepID=A0A7C8IG93_9PEZI|nr:hypothetical protein GQX73_g10686 [Xylaria multiplex]
MSDPLSVAGSVVGIISLGIQVTQSLSDYYTTFKSQHSDIAHTMRKLDDLLGMLENLRNLVEKRRFQADEETLVGNIESLIGQCEECIQELQDEAIKFEKTPVDSKQPALKAAIRRAAYPFRKSTLEKLDEDIGEITDVLRMALQLLQQKSIDCVQDDVEDVKELLQLVRFSQISSELRIWLKAPDATINFNEACSNKHPRTGLWLVKSADFCCWLKSRNSFLWLKGFAGSDPRTGLSFFFFSFNDESKQDASAMIRSLISQLSTQLDNYDDLSRLHDEYPKASPPNEALLDCLHQIVKRFGNVYILIDALDESPRNMHREVVLEVIESIRTWREPSLHLLVTSRDEVDIRVGLNATLEETMDMKNVEVDRDIADFIAQHLRENRGLKKWQRYYDQIETVLTDRAKGVFRWAECQFKALARCPANQHLLSQVLQSLPQSLDETYARMLKNIPPELWDYARQMLIILCCAVRPLSETELADALAVELGGTPRFDIARRFENLEALQEICPGFTEVDINIETKERTIRIAHFSVQEYLQSERILIHQEIAQFHIQTQDSHTKMTSICLALLLEPQMTRLGRRRDIKAQYPLAEYAAQYWPTHLKRGITKEEVEAQILRLFKDTKGAFLTWVNIWDIEGDDEELFLNYQVGRQDFMTRVNYAAVLGLDKIIRKLLDKEYLVSLVTVDGPTSQAILSSLTSIECIDVSAERLVPALLAAVHGQHYDSVEVLVEKGANMNAGLDRHGNALHVATLLDDGDMVQWLLDRGADINAEGGSFGTVLQTAVGNGRERIVQILLDRGADVNANDEHFGTALQIAVQNENERIVQILLDRGADVNANNRRFGTALQIAFQNGNKRIDQILDSLVKNARRCGQLHDFAFNPGFPLLLHSRESPLPCRETAEELEAVSKHFSAQIRALFEAVQEFQALHEQEPCIHEDGLILCLNIRGQSFDRYPECLHRMHHSHRVPLCDLASLPRLSSVTGLGLVSALNYSAQVPFSNVRSVSPRVPLDLLAHLPRISELDCPWLWERTPVAFQSPLLRHYTRPWEGLWRDSRHEFARAVRELDGRVPASLRKARLWFWLPGYVLQDDQSVQMPNLIHPASVDPISVSLRVIASHLEELDLRAFLTTDLFSTETPWPRLKRLRVEFHPLRPDGSWYFVGPRGENPNALGFEVRDEHYPLVVQNREDEDIDELWFDNEDAYEEENHRPDMFRTEPLSENIEPLLVAFATAIRETPSLEEAELFAYVTWRPSEERRAEYTDDIPYEDGIHRWGVRYVSAKGGSQGLVEWQVGAWRPQESIMKLFEVLEGDGEVVVTWKPFDFIDSRTTEDISYAALTVEVALQAINGGFRDAPYRDAEQMSFVLKLNYIARPFAIFTVLVVKIAVGYLILRILAGSPSRGIKYFIWVLLGFNTIIGILDAIFIFTQCDVPAALWDATLAPTAHCWRPSIKTAFGTFSASLNVVTDFILAVIPATIVWRLQLSVQKRLGLIILLGAGILSVVSAAIKTYKLSLPFNQENGSVAEEAYELYAWTSAEIFILHFCASIPSCKPIWDHFISRKCKPAFSNQGYKLSNIDRPLISNKWTVTSVGSQGHLQEDGLAGDLGGTSWVPFGELARIDRPTGIYLFYLPHLFGTLYATSISDSASLLAVVLDYEYDRQVLRCRLRPVARGAVTLFQAHVFTVFLTSLALVFLFLLPQSCWFISLPSIFLLALYPFAKRFTDFPQMILGVQVGIGVFMGIAAIDDSCFRDIGGFATIRSNQNIQAMMAFYLANACWTVVYDTIYAQQDVEDDVKAGVRSIAVRFRGNTRALLWSVSSIVVATLLASGYLQGFGYGYMAVTCGGTMMSLSYMLSTVNFTVPTECAWWFRNGTWLVGSSISGGLILEIFRAR